MNLFGVMDISGSALEAERIRAEVVSANMANANTTRTEKRETISAPACRLSELARRSAAGLCEHTAFFRRVAGPIAGNGRWSPGLRRG